MGVARRSVRSSALPRRRGARSNCLAAQRKAGAVQPRSVLLSVAALTGPPTAAQPGIPLWPLVRKPCVAGTPRRPRLGGMPHGAAVDDGGVDPRPARPNNPASSAPYRLAPRACGAAWGPWDTARARAATAGHQRFAAADSARRGRPHAAAWADHGRGDRASTSACSSGVVHTCGGKRCTRAAELLSLVGLQEPACWESRGAACRVGKGAQALEGEEEG
jgi:hypothetical protein